MANKPRGFGLTAELARKQDAKFDQDLASEALLWISEVLKVSENEEVCLVSDKLFDAVWAEGKITQITQKDVQVALKDGIALCYLINEIFKEEQQPPQIDADVDGDISGEEWEQIDTDENSTEKNSHRNRQRPVQADVITNVNVPRNGAKLSPFREMENISRFLEFAQDPKKMNCKPSDMFQSVDLHDGRNIPQVVNAIFAIGRKHRTLGPKEADKNKRVFTAEQLKQSEGVIRLQSGSNKGATQAGINFGKTRTIMD